MKTIDIILTILASAFIIWNAFDDHRQIRELKKEVSELKEETEEDEYIINLLICLIGKVDSECGIEKLDPIERRHWNAAVEGYQNFVNALKPNTPPPTPEEASELFRSPIEEK